MNRTKIEWADLTWNPVTGCLHGCEYCYARRIAGRFGFHAHEPEINERVLDEITVSGGKNVTYPFDFEPTFHRYRLDEPQHRKKPRTIFVCSMADLFGEWVPDEWIQEVFAACVKAPQHQYLFLTKNPARYLELLENRMIPDGENFWLGTTVTNPDTNFAYSNHRNMFLSIEPLLEPFGSPGNLHSCPPKWIIIGAMTGPGSKKYQPKREWVDEIVEAARDLKIPIFMKDSLIPIVGEADMLREFPWNQVETLCNREKGAKKETKHWTRSRRRLKGCGWRRVIASGCTMAHP